MLYTILILLFMLMVVVLFFLYVIRFDSVQIDPKSPFYKDEIEVEGTHNFKVVEENQNQKLK